jgi:hypothetical protein
MKSYFIIAFAIAGLIAVLSVANIVPHLLFPPVAVQRVEIIPPDPAELQIVDANSHAVVRNGDQFTPVANVLKDLRSVSAESGEASRANRTLNILVVDLPETTGAIPEIGLDLREAGDAGFVIVSNGPVVWSIRGAPPGARAKLAFESQSILFVKDATPGLLAGFRIAAFGAPNVVTPADYLRRDVKWRFQNFCATMQNWSVYFGAPFDQTRIWTYEQTPEFHLRATEIVPEGRRPQWARSIAVECAAPPPPPVDPPPLRRVTRRSY